METFNLHEAKTHLSKLVERASKGESFVIAKAGKPMVKLVPMDESTSAPRRRLGILEGLYEVPDDFDVMGREEIKRMFYGDDAS